MSSQESKYFTTASYMDEALLLLLETKDFEFITVKEICQKAGVNRSTFYLHYQNTSELLEETIELLNKKFISSFPKNILLSIKDKILTSPEFLIPYLNFVKENKRAYKLIHQKPELFSADKAFKKMYKDIFAPALDNYNVAEAKKAYVFEFYTKGSLAIIQKWVEEDCKDDIDFIVSLIAKHTFADEKDY